MNLFNWLKKLNDPLGVVRTIERTGRVVDFCNRGWGHNISLMSDGSFASWCTPRLSVGDVIRTELGEFLITSARPCYDPPDMAFCICINLKRLELRAEQRAESC